jgi:hypothetical protein
MEVEAGALERKREAVPAPALGVAENQPQMQN